MGYLPEDPERLSHDIQSNPAEASASPIAHVWGSQWRVRLDHVVTPSGILRDNRPYLTTAYIATDYILHL